MCDQLSDGLRSVMGSDLDLCNAFDNVVVSENVPAWIDDDTGSHSVDLFDFGDLKDAVQAQGNGVAAVPEPNSMLLLCLGFLASWARRFPERELECFRLGTAIGRAWRCNGR